MLQLFASPAGRALLTSDNRRRGSTSTSSLSRESSSRLKRSRRPSGTVSAPTTPPRQRKSSAELYKEAVEILGLTCSLTDSCPCIDCQVKIERGIIYHNDRKQIISQLQYFSFSLSRNVTLLECALNF